MLLWDPPGEGARLTREEAEDHAQALRRLRDASIEARLGNPERVVRIAIEPTDEDMNFEPAEDPERSRGGDIGRPSREPHEGNYLAAIVTPLGVRAIRDEDDLQALHAIRRNFISATRR